MIPHMPGDVPYFLHPFCAEWNLCKLIVRPTLFVTILVLLLVFHDYVIFGAAVAALRLILVTIVGDRLHELIALLVAASRLVGCVRFEGALALFVQTDGNHRGGGTCWVKCLLVRNGNHPCWNLLLQLSWWVQGNLERVRLCETSKRDPNPTRLLLVVRLPWWLTCENRLLQLLLAILDYNSQLDISLVQLETVRADITNLQGDFNLTSSWL